MLSHLILLKVFNFALKAKNEWIIFISLERLFQTHSRQSFFVLKKSLTGEYKDLFWSYVTPYFECMNSSTFSRLKSPVLQFLNFLRSRAQLSYKLLSRKKSMKNQYMKFVCIVI